MVLQLYQANSSKYIIVCLKIFFLDVINWILLFWCIQHLKKYMPIYTRHVKTSTYYVYKCVYRVVVAVRHRHRAGAFSHLSVIITNCKQIVTNYHNIVHIIGMLTSTISPSSAVDDIQFAVW
jgi:hypothetical protein